MIWQWDANILCVTMVSGITFPPIETDQSSAKHLFSVKLEQFFPHLKSHVLPMIVWDVFLSFPVQWHPNIGDDTERKKKTVIMTHKNSQALNTSNKKMAVLRFFWDLAEITFLSSFYVLYQKTCCKAWWWLRENAHEMLDAAS